MADRYEYYVGQLEGDYLETFKKIQRYANVSIIGKKYKREVLSSILDTFLNAQSEGKDISKVVGKDTEKFCRQCFGENPLREHILPVFEYMLPFALAWLVILAWNVFDIIVSRNAAGDKIGFFHITVNLDIPPFRLNGIGISLIAVLSYVIFWIMNGMIKKMLFGKHAKNIMLLQCMKGVAFVLCVIVGIVADTFIPFCTPAWIEFTLLTPPVIIGYGFLKIYDYLQNRKYQKEVLAAEGKPAKKLTVWKIILLCIGFYVILQVLLFALTLLAYVFLFPPSEIEHDNAVYEHVYDWQISNHDDNYTTFSVKDGLQTVTFREYDCDKKHEFLYCELDGSTYHKKNVPFPENTADTVQSINFLSGNNIEVADKKVIEDFVKCLSSEAYSVDTDFKDNLIYLMTIDIRYKECPAEYTYGNLYTDKNNEYWLRADGNDFKYFKLNETSPFMQNCLENAPPPQAVVGGRGRK